VTSCSRIDEQTSVDELVLETARYRVGENCLQLDGSSIGINLVVDACQAPVAKRPFVPGRKLLQAASRPFFTFFRIFWKIVFGYRENNRDRLQLGNETTSPFASVACTIFPTSTKRSPTRPRIGAVMRQ
jgi:hypothetical protein